MTKALPIDTIVTPVYQTPEGILFVILCGLIVAIGTWRARQSVNLLFVRLSGGSTKVGHAATVILPALILAATAAMIAAVAF